MSELTSESQTLQNLIKENNRLKKINLIQGRIISNLRPVVSFYKNLDN